MKVLDHGFVILRNVSGPTRRPEQPFDAHDTDPSRAARMSFDAMDSDRTEDQDMKLADYLMRNWHTSPFEMIQVWLEMKMPIFVARQFVRHRTARLNEVSGRYVELPAEWYIPEVVGGKAASNKQGQEDNLDARVQNHFRYDLRDQCAESYSLYQYHLSQGVAPEHARMFLHLNHYTHWLWNQDLHNLMHLLSLRLDSHAQVEAQAYAQAIEVQLCKVLPRCMDLFDKYRRQK